MEERTCVCKQSGDSKKTLTISPSSFPKWLDFVDFLSSRLLAILVVGYWKGTWSLMDDNIYPDNKYRSSAVSFVLGPGISLTAMIFQRKVKIVFSQMGFISRILATRVYLYIIALSSVNNWRWLWCLLDEATGKDYLSVSVCLGVGIVSLVISMTLVIAVVCPSVIDMDINQNTDLNWPLYFQQPPGTTRYVADCLFTVLIIGSFVIAIWRGWWGLLNLFLFPDNSLASALYSLVISQCVALALFLFENSIRAMSVWCEENHWILKLVYEDVITILHFGACVLMWRGEWMLLDRHVLNPTTRYILCHFLSFLILTFALASNSLMTRNCSKDGVLPEGQGTCFDYHYVTNMMAAYQEWKSNGKTISMYLSREKPEELRPISGSQKEIPDYSLNSEEKSERRNGCIK